MKAITKISLTLFLLLCVSHLKSSDKVINSFSEVYTNLNDNNINPKAIYLGLMGYKYLTHNNQITNDSLLVIIDYTKPSYKERFYVINVKNKSIVCESLVAHGKNSGDTVAIKFSNKRYSNMSSLGFFVTGETYSGKHGYSLRLDGIEPGINNNARERNVVIHAAQYVNSEFVEKHGRAGRSFGCPALPENNSQAIINLIKNGVCVFAFSEDYLKLLNSNTILEKYLAVENNEKLSKFLIE